MLNTRLTNTQIAKILKEHNIPYYIREEDDRIFADSMLAGTKEFEKVIDLTGYTGQQLRKWLGY